MNRHVVSSTFRLISESRYFILITEWWYPGQINVSAVLYATVHDFKKHPLQTALLLSVTLAVGSAARDQGSQAQHCASTLYRNRHFSGDFQCWGCSLSACRLNELQAESKLRRLWRCSPKCFLQSLTAPIYWMGSTTVLGWPKHLSQRHSLMTCSDSTHKNQQVCYLIFPQNVGHE